MAAPVQGASLRVRPMPGMRCATRGFVVQPRCGFSQHGPTRSWRDFARGDRYCFGCLFCWFRNSYMLNRTGNATPLSVAHLLHIATISFFLA